MDAYESSLSQIIVNRSTAVDYITTFNTTHLVLLKAVAKQSDAIFAAADIKMSLDSAFFTNVEDTIRNWDVSRNEILLARFENRLASSLLMRSHKI